MLSKTSSVAKQSCSRRSRSELQSARKNVCQSEWSSVSYSMSKHVKVGEYVFTYSTRDVARWNGEDGVKATLRHFRRVKGVLSLPNRSCLLARKGDLRGRGFSQSVSVRSVCECVSMKFLIDSASGSCTTIWKQSRCCKCSILVMIERC